MKASTGIPRIPSSYSPALSSGLPRKESHAQLAAPTATVGAPAGAVDADAALSGEQAVIETVDAASASPTELAELADEMTVSSCRLMRLWLIGSVAT